jgi:hypothetical protein
MSAFNPYGSLFFTYGAIVVGVPNFVFMHVSVETLIDNILEKPKSANL